MAEFAYLTGWRVHSEVLPLEWRNVDLKAGIVTLDPGTTKNGEGRTIYLTTALRTLLEAQEKASEALKATNLICPFVFHRHGQRIKDFYRAWRTAHQGGMPGQTPARFPAHGCPQRCPRRHSRACGDGHERAQDPHGL